MDQTFDASKYIKVVGDDLVCAFERARRATTPSLVGAAMEKAARDQLTQVLPRGLSVGSGCVIDTDGRTSKQMDIVLYEKNICPVFSINDNPETTYYPCEGVIAVGEVKSSIGKAELVDSFKKITSVKTLRRNYYHPSHNRGDPIPYRRYGELSSPEVLDPSFDPNTNELSHILGFILGGRMAAGGGTVFDHYVEMLRDSVKAACPNLTIFLEGGAFLLKDTQHGKLPVTALSALGANSVSYIDAGPLPFSTLIRWLFNAYRTGLTSHAQVFDRYLQVPPEELTSFRLEFFSGRQELADHFASLLTNPPSSDDPQHAAG